MNLPRQGSVLLITSVASFATAFMASALNVALPLIGKTFSVDAVLLGWVATAYTLAIAICLVPFGRVADIHGRMRVFTIGVFGFLITSLLCCFATSGTMLITFRALQGIGAAMMFATSSALLSPRPTRPRNEGGC